MFVIRDRFVRRKKKRKKETVVLKSVSLFNKVLSFRSSFFPSCWKTDGHWSTSKSDLAPLRESVYAMVTLLTSRLHSHLLLHLLHLPLLLFLSPPPPTPLSHTHKALLLSSIHVLLEVFLQLSQTDELMQFLVVAGALSDRLSGPARGKTAMKIASLAQERLLDLSLKTTLRNSPWKKSVSRKRSISLRWCLVRPAPFPAAPPPHLLHTPSSLPPPPSNTVLCRGGFSEN